LPNSFTSTAVFARDGAESTFERRVVLPLPRKPVTTVTGFFDVLASVHKCRVQGGVKRVKWPAGEPFRRGPQGTQVLYQLGASLAVAQDIFATAPVFDPEAVMV
jgi:hypothetical protein